MYRFFVPQEQIGPELIAITGPDVNHMKNVLRMKPGEQVLISNKKDRDYLCSLETLTSDRVEAKILNVQEESRELPARIWLFQGLPKGDKMELIIQKAVELGAFALVPVAMKRSVVKLDPKKAQGKGKRWNAIAESGAKQSKRVMIPEVKEVMTFRQALETAADFELKLFPYEKAEGMEATRRLLSRAAPGQDIAVLIGPEGGFSEEEAEEASQAGFTPISLGRRILRTETAGLAALSLLMYRLEAGAEKAGKP